MASNTVEQIFVELLLNAKGYSKEADDAVKKSEKLEKGLGNTEKQSVKTNKSFDGLLVERSLRFRSIFLSNLHS